MTGPERDSQLLTPLERLLSIDEVAQLLRISESGVYRLIRRGELASLKIGGKRLFEPQQLRRFIADRTLGGANEGQLAGHNPEMQQGDRNVS